jgi:MerR family transcriptional regulator/heat shock protein HspR
MARRDEDDKSKPLYMISVAAELTGMHPQTLRVYEQKGLVTPGRSRGNTRLYSQGDIERLNLISKLTDEGINLAGVVRILDMRERAMERDKEIDRLRRRVRELEDEVHELRMREKITCPRPLRRRGTGAGHARTALERQGPRRLRLGRRARAGSFSSALGVCR